MSDTADILFIGGGMAGIGAAARAAPAAKVIVLEAEDQPGRHSTGRSAAIFIGNYGNATVRAANAASQGELASPPDDLADSSLLTPRGELLIATAEEVERFEQHMAGASETEEIDPDEAVRRFPILRRERIARACYDSTAEDIDVDRLLQGYLRLLRRLGGRLVTDARAGEIAHRDGTWRVTTSAGEFEAPVVVNASGAWADTTAKLAGLPPLGLQPLRRSAAILPAPEGRDVTGWPAVCSMSETWYAKPEAGKLMVSPADEDPVDPHDAWPEDMVLAEGLDRYEQAVTVPVTRVERTWAGLRTFAPDRTPVVGFDPAAEGFFWLAGQGGYGIQTAPALSRLAAALLTGGDGGDVLPRDAVAALAPHRLRASA
ncbi:MAG TPA: FAD-binding oxidoreductase [Kiloniellaceae bacterium]|nr:FAD-binding oxidoreductase [Kiloniellaceae bacterium]